METKMKKIIISLILLQSFMASAFTVQEKNSLDKVTSKITVDCSAEHFERVVKVGESEPGYYNSLNELEIMLKTCSLDINQFSTTLWHERTITALIYSTVFLNVNKIELLVSYGADINLKEIGRHENSPLIAVSSQHKRNKERFNKSKKIAKFFIDNGAEVNLSNKYNKSPLMYASDTGNLELVKYLADAGADINQKSSAGSSAIMWASRPSKKNGGHKVVNFLIENGANVNQQTYKKEATALMWAAIAGNLETVKILVNANANINAEQTSGKTAGYTALMWAAKKGHCKIVNFLKKTGATKTIACK